MKTAVLICNGPSAEGYQPPEGAFSLCLNDGFTRHRADAALTVDCPESLRAAWSAFGGRRVLTDANPAFSQMDELLEGCEPLMRRYRSSAACGLAWLAGQGFSSALVVGMDALGGGGKPGAAYSAGGHVAMLAEFAPKFPGGLRLLQGGKEVAVGPGLTCPTRPTGQTRPTAPPAVSGLPDCQVPQRLVEFDLCSDCTRACEFCAPGIPAARRKKKLRLPLALHNRVVDALAAAGYSRPDRHVAYCGHGEPLLHPRFLDMVRHARGKLPAARIFIYTNGDRLDARTFSALGALGIDAVVYDCYDDATGRKVYAAMRASTIDPARVRCMDHVGRKRSYSGRCGALGAPAPGGAAGPCTRPANALFLAADGSWRLCCEDYAWKSSWSGRLGPVELNAESGYAKILSGLSGTSGRSDAHPICAACSRKFGEGVGYGSHPLLAGVTRLRPKPSWPKVRKGYRRLVVVPCASRSQGADQVPAARVVLDAVDRRSRVAGKTLLLWNDDKVRQCPAELRGDPERRIVWEYERALGWAGINRGIGEAFLFAVREGYDAVIKMDAADVAVMRDGWDAYVLEGLKPGEMSGCWVATAGAHYGGDLAAHDGPCRHELLCAGWPRDALARRLNVDGYCQGGCYALGRAAIERMDRLVGMPTEAEKNVGEDRAFTMRAQALQVPIRGNPRIQSHFCRTWDYSLSAARHFRDDLGRVVIHPVRRIEALKALCSEGPA